MLTLIPVMFCNKMKKNKEGKSSFFMYFVYVDLILVGGNCFVNHYGSSDRDLDPSKLI